MPHDITIRREMSVDHLAVRKVNELAFGRILEAALVERLREGCPGLFSLVAAAGAKIVGHILRQSVYEENQFTRIKISLL